MNRLGSYIQLDQVDWEIIEHVGENTYVVYDMTTDTKRNVNINDDDVSAVIAPFKWLDHGVYDSIVAEYTHVPDFDMVGLE